MTPADIVDEVSEAIDLNVVTSSTEIVTDSGIKQVFDVKSGDKILGSDGNYYNVINVNQVYKKQADLPKKVKTEVIPLNIICENADSSDFNVKLRTKINSATRQGRVYNLTTEGYQHSVTCECEAYDSNKPCWHIKKLNSDLLVIKKYTDSVVKCLIDMKVFDVEKDKFIEYMKIKFYSLSTEDMNIIQSYRSFILKNLFFQPDFNTSLDEVVS